MKLFKTLLASAAGSALLVSAAQGATISPTFQFSGSIQAGGGGVETLGPDYPVGGTVRRSNGNAFSAFATVTASGFDDPVDGVTFANGVTAFGGASATSNNRVVVTITNESTIAETLFWNGTIFGGGAGIVEPNSSCNLSTLDMCIDYSAPGGAHDASAQVVFGATLDSTSLFEGEISVSDTVQTSSFSGIELENFRLADGSNGDVVNSQYYWWDETKFGIDLGTLAAGESKTLEFFVMTSAIASSADGCAPFEGGPLVCIGAQAGFGDPDSNGGNQLSSGLSYRSLSFSSSTDNAMAISAEAVPIPGGIWLFAPMIAGGLGWKRIKKKG
ncbi:hypothetical protein HK107_08960 [Parvularcula sp. ZS-1/3]|uniref:VPLPA-CTERM sorting domain-containing protein n=1 Tax=Parvularcula mediterranea TaxID=2732508 RepID=A0A7Y3W5E9_9PROT|nr:hypothetical protein [Parvularcula mediterranea]NNU16448.1 hypothetical protein [Parvularcula mediterranea]